MKILNLFESLNFEGSFYDRFLYLYSEDYFELRQNLNL